MFRYIQFSFIVLVFCFFAACVKSPHYQKTFDIPGNEWYYNNSQSFTFDITDTTKGYNLFFLIRHTESYPYSNIWIWVLTKKPGDKVFEKTRLEIPLAEPGGKWLGRGIGAIWEQRMPISNDQDTVMLRKKGKWEIRVEQDMRINPLPEVLQIGLRIEKRPLNNRN